MFIKSPVTFTLEGIIPWVTKYTLWKLNARKTFTYETTVSLELILNSKISYSTQTDEMSVAFQSVKGFQNKYCDGIRN